MSGASTGLPRLRDIAMACGRPSAAFVTKKQKDTTVTKLSNQAVQVTVVL